MISYVLGKVWGEMASFHCIPFELQWEGKTNSFWGVCSLPGTEGLSVAVSTALQDLI